MFKLELALYICPLLFNRTGANSKLAEVFSLMKGLWGQAERDVYGYSITLLSYVGNNKHFYSLTSEYIKRIFFYPVDIKKNIILAVLMKIPDFKTQHYFQGLLKTHLVSRCAEHLAHFQGRHHYEIAQEAEAKKPSLFIGHQSLFLNAVCQCLSRILCMALGGRNFCLTPIFVRLLWKRYFCFSVCSIENKSIMTGWPLWR